MSKLFLIPTTLATNIDHSVLLPHQLTQIHHLQHFVVETAKIGRQHLKQLHLAHKIQDLEIKELNKHQQELNQLVQPLLNGYDIGVISDCGMPAVADPGSQLIKIAHQHNIAVIPLVSNNSLLSALMASGVNGQSFAFNGYLPIAAQEKINQLKKLEQLIMQEKQSQILIETPFRNQQLLSQLIEALNDNIILAIAVELMNPEQQIISKSIREWKQLSSLPQIHKKEVVFVLGYS